LSRAADLSPGEVGANVMGHLDGDEGVARPPLSRYQAGEYPPHGLGAGVVGQARDQFDRVPFGAEP